eukprot:m.66382 g.66382  ORF g.66382 m.66382 type:complete len:164 (-) comp15946_c0_seq2:881-1372(-)
MQGFLINTTHLHQRMQFTGTIGPQGTTWTTPSGQSYTCQVQNGQEIFEGHLVLPTHAATFAAHMHTDRANWTTPAPPPPKTPALPAAISNDIPTLLNHLATHQTTTPEEHAIRVRLAHLGCITTKNNNDAFLDLHCRLHRRGYPNRHPDLPPFSNCSLHRQRD